MSTTDGRARVLELLRWLRDKADWWRLHEYVGPEKYEGIDRELRGMIGDLSRLGYPVPSTWHTSTWDWLLASHDFHQATAAIETAIFAASGEGEDADQVVEAVTEREAAILRYLAEEPHVAKNVYQIEAGAEMDRKTASPYLDSLVAKGLAVRMGKPKGWAATSKGLATVRAKITP